MRVMKEGVWRPTLAWETVTYLYPGSSEVSFHSGRAEGQRLGGRKVQASEGSARLFLTSEGVLQTCEVTADVSNQRSGSDGLAKIQRTAPADILLMRAIQ